MDEAFMKSFASHQRAIYALIRSFCRRPQDADDIFQETFMVAWRKREEYEPGTNFFAWAGCIARLEALAHARREGRSNVLFDEALLQDLADRAVRQQAVFNERLQALRHCLAALSENHRQLIENRYTTGRSVSSLAERLGRSANSVSVALHGIRQKLLSCIERRLAGKAL